MLALKYLIKDCISRRVSPEQLLQLEPLQHTSQEFASRLRKLAPGKAYEAAKNHLPEAIRILIKTQGFDCADLVARLYSYRDNPVAEEELKVISDQIRESGLNEPVHQLLLSIPGMTELLRLWEFGLSLSWVIFEWGEPIWRKPYLPDALPADLDFYRYLKSSRGNQGLHSFEQLWWTGSTLEVGLVHMTLLRMLATLPKITVFPQMPEFGQVLQIIKDIIKTTELPEGSDPLLCEVLKRLKHAPSKICVLFFATQAMVLRWLNDGVVPRMATQRYCYLIIRLFNMYGREAGLLFWLNMLNDIARAFKYTDLLEIVEKGRWGRPEKKDIFRSQDSDSGSSPMEETLPLI